jgi:ubiquinone/menaquinone biosynthesis C-methylase UbiE
MDWVEQFFDGPFYAPDYARVAADDERTRREAEFIRTQLALEPGDYVLDLACGSGRHALAIAPHVGRVLGLDRTASMIEEARRRAVDLAVANVEFEQQDMRELDSDGEFDAAYNYFTAWGYYDYETNLDVLRRVLKSLKPGGKFLLEILNRGAVLRKFRAVDWNRVDEKTVALFERRFDFATGRMHSKYTYLTGAEKSEVEIDHYVPASDALIRHFADAGFSDVRLVAATDGGEVTLDTWRIAVIGSRPG